MQNNDLISRDKALRMLKFNKYNWYGSGSMEDIDKVMEDIKNLPAVDAEPVRHGRWVINKRFGDYECSECGHGDVTIISIRKFDMMFCPKCGAKMDLEVL